MATGLAAASEEDAPPLPTRVFLSDRPLALSSPAAVSRMDERREVTPAGEEDTAAMPVTPKEEGEEAGEKEDEEAAAAPGGDRMLLACCVCRMGDVADAANALAMTAERGKRRGRKEAETAVQRVARGAEAVASCRGHSR